ncbi:MAG: aquaporin [Treponema sp.]|nr:aquaporin [Treponema sp.]
MSNSCLKKYFAELIGTAVLVFMGCGSAVFLGCETTGGHLAVALAFGFSVVAMAYAVGDVSGCHINPAVSLAMFLDKRISGGDFCTYFISQITGGIIGAVLLKIVSGFAGVDHTGCLGANLVAGAGGTGNAFLVEVVLSFIFLLTILSITADITKSGVAGIVIGLTLTFVHIVGIPLTGTSVNPARSLGPALFMGGKALSDLWVFILAPCTGAVLAVLVYKVLREKMAKK